MANEPQGLLTRRTILTAVGLILVAWALLYFEGRPWWCKYGAGIWAGARSRCTSQHLFDPYTLTHVLHGILFFWLLWPLASRLEPSWRFLLALGLEIAWEVLENSPWVVERYRQDTVALDYTGDSILNAVGDILATLAGFLFASRFSWRASVMLFVVFELWMLYWARDNLTLNVLMLLAPIDAVKQWQLQA